MLSLYPYQEAHVQRLKSILSTSRFALDLSALGSGKSYTTMQLAKDLNLALIIVAPVSVKTKWRELQATHDLNIAALLSYQEVRSIKCSQPKHGLLHRIDHPPPADGPEPPPEFKPTQKFLEMVSQGVLLVFDEIQALKNNSATTHACGALIQAASKVLLLSGSPIDKKPQVAQLFSTLGVIKEPLCFFDRRTQSYYSPGFEQFLRYAATFGSIPTHPYRNPAICTAELYRIFQRNIKPKISSAMQPTQNRVSILKQNSYFKLENQDSIALLDKAIQGLKTAASFQAQGADLGNITLALMQLETAKLETFVRLAQQTLIANPQAKVALCMNFSASIKDLTEHPVLAPYSPLTLTGATSEKNRTRAIQKFQEPSTSHRLLICNSAACNAGIDLDDKHGAFPRTVYVSPSYHTISLYQLCHRFLRQDTASQATVHMVYIQGHAETRVLTSLAAKSSIMKETTAEQARAGALFPCDFPSFYE